MKPSPDETVHKFAKAIAKAQGHPDCDAFAEQVVCNYNEPDKEPEKEPEPEQYADEAEADEVEVTPKGKKAKKQSY